VAGAAGPTPTGQERVESGCLFLLLVGVGLKSNIGPPRQAAAGAGGRGHQDGFMAMSHGGTVAADLGNVNAPSSPGWGLVGQGGRVRAGDRGSVPWPGGNGHRGGRALCRRTGFNGGRGTTKLRAHVILGAAPARPVPYSRGCRRGQEGPAGREAEGLGRFLPGRGSLGGPVVVGPRSAGRRPGTGRRLGGRGLTGLAGDAGTVPSGRTVG